MFDYGEDSDGETVGTREEPEESDDNIVAGLAVWVPVSAASSTKQETPGIGQDVSCEKPVHMVKFRITGNDTIGRDPVKNSIVIDSESISSEHATIVAFENNILLTPCKVSTICVIQ